MILSRLVLDRAGASGARLKNLATLEFSEPGGAADVSARAAPELVGPEHPLANVEGTGARGGLP